MIYNRLYTKNKQNKHIKNREAPNHLHFPCHYLHIFIDFTPNSYTPSNSYPLPSPLLSLLESPRPPTTARAAYPRRQTPALCRSGSSPFRLPRSRAHLSPRQMPPPHTPALPKTRRQSEPNRQQSPSRSPPPLSSPSAQFRHLFPAKASR